MIEIDISKHHFHKNSLARLLKIPKLNKVGIINKISNFGSSEILANEIERLSTVSIMPHYALQHNYGRDMASIYQNFVRNAKTLNKNRNINSILIVSGGQRKLWGTVELLNQMKLNNYICPFGIAVAFNPFLRGDDLDIEKSNFINKCSSGQINQVYFQIGDNLEALKAGIKFIQTIGIDLTVKVCVLIPNKRVLVSLKFRPWSKVIISEKYLNDLKYAEFQTKKILDLLSSERITPYFELVPLDERSVEDLMKFI